ncbi:MAG: hypothetical protein KZQ78_09115 [Candidatus Thiodiazotropha sp. (ex Ustalcina ferruginea)]|nr:hypothetical protein [Candidatus Thiodiazotropha sp. (ex Ustalcina ferruginea)]
MKKLLKTAIFLMTFLTASLLFANIPPIEPALKRQMDNDMEVVQIQRQGLADTLHYMAYETTGTKAGINLPVVDILGRLATPANLIVKQFDRHYETADRQFDLVLFLDGQEKSRVATEGNLASFRDSWKRPKWHVLTQGTVLGERR